MNKSFAMSCILISVWFISGCTGSATLLRSTSELKAARLQSRALSAAEKQEYENAEKLLLEALAINRSIEDNPQKAITLVNLARLQRLNNDTGKATLNMARALAIPLHAQNISAEVYYEKALLDLALNRADEALKAARTSFDAEEIYHGKRRNLIARSLYESGKYDEALNEVTKALSENRSSRSVEEEANSLYLLGVLTREKKLFGESSNHLIQALNIDKQQGISTKIGRDLEGLADTSIANNMTKEAQIYLERALELYGATGENNKTKSIREHIQKLTISPSSKP